MGMRNMRNMPPVKNRDASVTVKPDWNTIEEMDFPRLAKLSLPNVEEGQDVYVYLFRLCFLIFLN
jgi:translation initiation factor 3 subunit D